MTPFRRGAALLLCGGLVAACSLSRDDPAASLDPLAPGGTHLTVEIDRQAAWPPPALINHAPEADSGRRLFYRNWLSARRDGRPLAGPGLDDATCAGCHIEMARPGDRTLDYDPLLIARPVTNTHQRRFGAQVHRFRIGDQSLAATLQIEQVHKVFEYPDGTVRRLQYPVAHAAPPDGERFAVALRAAPLLFGWGLLARVDPAMLAHFHDPSDQDRNGISGRMARIDNLDDGGATDDAIGRLGWKAGHARLRDQIRTALAHDMGVTSEPFCAHKADRKRNAKCRPEISEAELEALTDYVAGIGVPERRGGATRHGQDLFGQAGCAQCHVSVLQTLPADQPELDRQWIWAFTDLMLHDMGPELADPGDSPKAREWRTAPLWGAGLAEQWLPDRGFLHDGRARTLEEAVLWHGGEARRARDTFAGMSAEEREALLNYVRSL